MMKHLLTLTIAVCALLLMVACREERSAEQMLQRAEAAITMGEMEVASSVAQHLTDSTNLSGMSARQLARLSIIYMQLADSSDNAENVRVAADAYRRAFAAHPDSAREFYLSLPPDKANLAMILSTVAVRGNKHDLDSIDDAADDYFPPIAE